MTKEEFFALGGTQENLNNNNFSIEEFMTDLYDHQELSILYFDSEIFFSMYCKLQSYRDRIRYGYDDEFDEYIASEFKDLWETGDEVDYKLFGMVHNFFAR